MFSPTNLSLYIPRVFPNIDEERIKGVFQSLDIGRVNKVDFVSQEGRNGPYKSVYIYFSQFYDTSFLDRVCNSGTQGAKLVYDDPWYWIVLKNKSHRVDGRKVCVNLGPLGIQTATYTLLAPGVHSYDFDPVRSSPKPISVITDDNYDDDCDTDSMPSLVAIDDHSRLFQPIPHYDEAFDLADGLEDDGLDEEDYQRMDEFIDDLEQDDEYWGRIDTLYADKLKLQEQVAELEFQNYHLKMSSDETEHTLQQEINELELQSQELIRNFDEAECIIYERNHMIDMLTDENQCLTNQLYDIESRGDLRMTVEELQQAKSAISF